MVDEQPARAEAATAHVEQAVPGPQSTTDEEIELVLTMSLPTATDEGSVCAVGDLLVGERDLGVVGGDAAGLDALFDRGRN